MDVIWAVVSGAFLARHITEPRFALPAALLLATAQRALADVYAMRVRDTRWILISGPLLWMPMLIVLARFLGVDLYAIANGAWIVGNFVFGALALVAGFWFAKRFGPRLKTSTTAKRLADGFAGAISAFERD